jgi:hypothetical protein
MTAQADPVVSNSRLSAQLKIYLSRFVWIYTHRQ